MLGSSVKNTIREFSTKQLIADIAKKKKIETMHSYSVLGGETRTHDNIHGHHFNVPTEVYSDEKYHDKLNRARTLDEAENIVLDYYRRHKINK